MSVAFFDITRQNESLQAELQAALLEVVNSGRFILGKNVDAFEKEVAGYCGVKYAIGVASGTDALHLALRACGVKAGDEVITSPFTFVATAEAIAYCGAIPVFVDIEPNTFNLDPDKVESKITSKTKAILPVHLYGQSCNMEKLTSIAKKHALLLIEDCAQALGADFAGKKVGAWGHASCFSFFPTKNVGCFGDGGMVLTDDENIFDLVKVLRGHGSRKTYHYDIIGYNSRLDEIQAAVLRVKLKGLDNLIHQRRKIANIYHKYLKNIKELTLPFELNNSRHSYNQFTVRLKERDSLYEYLKVKGIGAMVYYPLSLHLQTAFASLKYRLGDLPESEAAQAEVLSLPIFPELSSNETEEVCATIKKFFEQ